jgi:t-SNARE complex subunit (syntaxin)
MKDKFINYSNHVRPTGNMGTQLDIDVDNFLRNPNQTRINDNDKEMKENNNKNISNFNKIIKQKKTDVKTRRDAFDDYERKNTKLNTNIKNGKQSKENDNNHMDFFINNDLRMGSASRLTNATYKKQKESLIINRFQYLTKNYQDPNKLVLPFPRGGEATRKVGKSGVILSNKQI